MHNMPTGYWGKFSSLEGSIRWLSLEDHLIDVASCFQVLMEAGYNKSFGILNSHKPLTKQQISRLCILALVHDIGKAIRDFQMQIFEDNEFERRHRGHTTVSCSIFFVPLETGIRDKFMSIFPRFDKWFKYGDEEGEISFASMLLDSWGHHGKPVEFDFENRPNEDNLSTVCWNNWNYLDFDKFIAGLQDIILDHWPEAYEDDVDPILASGPLMAEFNGLLTLADWMASDDRYFVYDHGVGSRYDFAIKTAQKMIKQSGRGSMMPTRSFEEIFDFTPNAMQKEFIDIGERLYN